MVVRSRHYEKVIVACCFLFLFVNVGMASSSFAVYQPYIVALPGVGDVGGSVVLSVRTLASFAAMFFSNVYLEHLGARRGAALGCLLTAVGFALYGLATSMPLLCVGAVLAGAGNSLGGMVAMTLLLNRWFKSRVSTAIAVASLGNGVASMTIPLMAVPIVRATSLHVAFFVDAAIAAAAATVVLLLLRDDPSDIGIEPFGAAEQAVRDDGTAVETHVPHDMLPTYLRVLLLVAMTCMGGICVGGMSYLSVSLTALGYGEVFAAAMVSVTGAFLIVSKIVTGEVFDHIGTRRGGIVMFSILALGLFLLCLAPLHVGVIAVAGSCLYGLGMAVGTVGISVWSLELSDEAHRGKTVKNFQVCYALGCFLFNLFPGALKEATGSYTVLYVILLVCSLFVAAVVTWSYGRYRRHLG